MNIVVYIYSQYTIHSILKTLLSQRLDMFFDIIWKSKISRFVFNLRLIDKIQHKSTIDYKLIN